MKRNFCGFCGTPLTVWSEEQPEDAHFICINLASLERGSLNLLDALDILPTAEEDNNDLVETASDQSRRPVRLLQLCPQMDID